MRVLLMISSLFLITGMQIHLPDNPSGRSSANSGIIRKKRDPYPIQPVDYTHVEVKDNFWKPRMETNRDVTLPYGFGQCEEREHIGKFTDNPERLTGRYGWGRSRDSDVYKLIEGACYALEENEDPALREKIEEIIDGIREAQWDDGYLYTYYTVPERRPERRWTDVEYMHELYNAGHMYEAAIAHYLTTGSRKFLDVALKNADLVCDIFGPGKREGPPGHQEIELALFKLYMITGDKKYRDQAEFFLEARGKRGNRGPDGNAGLYGTYQQDHKPVTEQEEAVGHVVRALYMYSGMTDMAAYTGNKEYIQTLNTLWEDIVHGKTYVTGGIGSTAQGESFGEAYSLPNESAYCETCAAIANAMWNRRMFRLHGAAKYMDVLERSLYNGILSGVSLEGDRFFYPNPLASDGNEQRSPWFRVACCPSNMARFLPQLPGYIYAKTGDRIYVNLYMENEAKIRVQDTKVNIAQKTNYPWDGKVSITVSPERETNFGLRLRVPGWARDEAIPGGLYRFKDSRNRSVNVTVNGEETEAQMNDGYMVINREWRSGDKVTLDLPMECRIVEAHEKVEEDERKVAVQRGPVVYAAEWPDNEYGKILNLVLDEESELQAEYRPDMLEGVTIIKGKAFRSKKTVDNGYSLYDRQTLTLIPYHVWANRGPGEMRVWLPVEKSAISLD